MNEVYTPLPWEVAARGRNAPGADIPIIVSSWVRQAGKQKKKKKKSPSLFANFSLMQGHGSTQPKNMKKI